MQKEHFCTQCVGPNLSSVPASQIECERVFSVAGQISSLLRNRMSVENLSTMVYLYKNLDQEMELHQLMRSTVGEKGILDMPKKFEATSELKMAELFLDNAEPLQNSSSRTHSNPNARLCEDDELQAVSVADALFGDLTEM